MNKKIIYIYLSLSVLLFAGCGDFLEEYAQNASYIERVDDLDELMLGECYLQLDDNTLQKLDLLADESQERLIAGNASMTADATYAHNRGIFGFMENPFTKLNGDIFNDPFWAPAYKRIAVLNSILQTVTDFETNKASELAQLDRIHGECLYLRAWNYFLLANLYGLPYDKTNPDDGGSVTLKTDPAVVDTKFGRNHSSVVYGQMVTDLTNAVSLLEKGERASSKRHVTPAACWALLSRVYLYMEEYGKTVDAADRVAGYELWNLASLYAPGNGESFLTTGCPEIIFAQGNSSDLHGGSGIEISELDIMTFILTGQIVYISTVTEWRDSYGVSEETAQLFDDTDLRYSAFFTRSWRKAYLMNRKYRGHLAVADPGSESESETDPITGEKVQGTATGDPVCGAASIRYAEVVLNKAEALACNGKAGEAAVLIGDFCQTRYTVQPVIPAGGDDLIRFIRQERQKELCYEGHRWFDLRRYAVNSVCPQTTPVRHILNMVEGSQVVEAGEVTLAAWSPTIKGAWTLPVPENVTDYCYPNLTNFDRLAGVTQVEY
ncbi:MAG: RagB/SusD family nutrient uptake outer membrane protein [Bacteroidales bacterium]|nr:RagB/SusD family nutrient uptake outer membrane protein [Bacteroidales bacterium]MDD3989213.1 RagB/SusD family nutrient uptake outer membrane protein [Bacteroidales bacterium]